MTEARPGRETADVSERPAFTESFSDVLGAELEYIEKRRIANALPPLDPDAPEAWGLALSGGGVRSATFAFGALQALIRRDRLKRFDYLSTVSGGGYIGSCLSSLLTNRPELGVQGPDSPFVALGELEPDAKPEETRLNARHQIHHLRTHGEYLVPRAKLLSRDVQRAVGSVLSGMGYTFSLFVLGLVAVACVVLALLNWIDPGLLTLAPGGPLRIEGASDLGSARYVMAVLSRWYLERVAGPIGAVVESSRGHLALLGGAAVFGMFWSLAWIVAATRLSDRLDRGGRRSPTDATRAGWTPDDQSESTFVRAFNVSSVAVALAWALAAVALLGGRGSGTGFLSAIAIPFAISVGGVILSHVSTFGAETLFARLSWRPGARSRESRLRRSLYAGIRGASLYGTVFAVVLPIGIVVAFSLVHFPPKFFLALGSLAWAYYLNRERSGTTTVQLGGWLHRPLANVAVLVFVVFSFAQAASFLLEYAPSRSEPVSATVTTPADRGDADSSRPAGRSQREVWRVTAVGFGGAVLILVAIGTLIDANRTSLHYFYRDRLTEAYLKTDARTVRSGRRAQGKPLVVLRDDEDLRLHDLGERNAKGPYHILVTALNLRGSDELTRKTFLSDHFEFTREFVGSRPTGWVRTRRYRKGTTRLARVMTISAAAVGSAMGYHTFGAQAFVTTLFNARLGYWMENPWLYRDGGRGIDGQRWVFWPKYLALEILGLASAREPLVNLSDGGHTGDNLGLLPLLRRRCGLILVCDAEADGEYAFGSFNNAVRMALIEQNVEIAIDLTPIQKRAKSDSGVMVSEASVVSGTIRYPATADGKGETEGRLIYVKSSIPDASRVHVLNYAKDHAAFPHEPTTDQFFDDAQFEAYRALGEHLGGVAAAML